jgi:polysaccharide biosynthesis PFTS motif protein
MERKTLVFARVSYGNIALCLALSCFFRIRCFRFRDSRIRRLLAGRITLFDWDSHGDTEEIMRFCNAVTNPTWAKKTKPAAGQLRISVDGYDVDVTEKMFKELGPTFQDMYQLARFGGEHEEYLPGIDAYLIARHTTAPIHVGSTIFLRACARLNILAEHLEGQAVRITRIMQDGARLMRSFRFSRCQWRASIVAEVPHASELSMDTEYRSFAWFLRDTDLSSRDILYLVSVRTTREILAELRDRNIQIVDSVFDLSRELSWKSRFAVLRTVFTSALKVAVGTMTPSILNEAYRWYPRLMCWSRLKSAMGIQTYVDTVSSATIGSYLTVYFKRLGVHTVMHTYSMNSSMSSSRIPSPEFHLSYSRFLHEYMTVWTRQYAVKIRSNYSEDLRFYISGPAMAGRENYDQSELDHLRSKYCGEGQKGRLVVSVFDVPPQIPGWASGNIAFYTGMYTENYCCAFFEDIFRLFREEAIIVIYKPKRDWDSVWRPGAAPCPPRMADIFEQVAEDARWATLPALINPWIPVLLSDLVVATPFTSICMAAQSRNIPFVFHNAEGTIKYHNNSEHESRISHSYEQLAEFVSRTKKRGNDSVQGCTQAGVAQGFVDFLRDPKRLSIGAEIDESSTSCSQM